MQVLASKNLIRSYSKNFSSGVRKKKSGVREILDWNRSVFTSGHKIARISEMFEFFLPLFYVGELVIFIILPSKLLCYARF